jgi:hypothetical protein
VITLFLVVPRWSLPPPATRVAITAGDDVALRTEDRDGWLIDLGVGHACVNFCIRTRDLTLVARLQAVEGSTWRDALDRAGAAMVERSPHRVVTTPLGRAEVYSPIPPPGGRVPRRTPHPSAPSGAQARPRASRRRGAPPGVCGRRLLPSSAGMVAAGRLTGPGPQGVASHLPRCTGNRCDSGAVPPL